MALVDKVPDRQVRDVISSGRDAERDRTEPIELAVVVDPRAPRPLVEAVRDALMPVHATAHLRVSRLEAASAASAARLDACVIVAGGSDGHVLSASFAYARAGTPVAILAESALDAPVPTLPTEFRRMVKDIVSTDEADVVDGLASWLVSTTEKGTAFAANFPSCRKARVDELVRACAAENGAIGVAGLVPGADMLIMTANQARLALDLAAAYGRPPSLERALELAGVVGAGFGYRALARGALGLVPGLGWLVRGAVAYLGTFATARALTHLFERADGVPGVPGAARGTVPTIGLGASGGRDALRGAGGAPAGEGPRGGDEAL